LKRLRLKAFRFRAAVLPKSHPPLFAGGLASQPPAAAGFRPDPRETAGLYFIRKEGIVHVTAKHRTIIAYASKKKPAVSRGGFFLLFHAADDFSVFDFAQLFCRNLTRRSLQAGLLTANSAGPGGILIFSKI
jgi:hypothetical protein